MTLDEISLTARLDEQIKALTAYADAAQNDINNQKQAIDLAQKKLLESHKAAQKEVDLRTGAIEQIKKLIEDLKSKEVEPTPDTEVK